MRKRKFNPALATALAARQKADLAAHFNKMAARYEQLTARALAEQDAKIEKAIKEAEALERLERAQGGARVARRYRK